MAETKIILFVVKDVGGLNVLRELARLLGEAGFKIEWVAEGLAMETLHNAGTPIFGGLPLKGTFAADTKMRFDIEPDKMLDQVNPVAVVASQGVPINLERDVVRAALKRGIPTTIVSDMHGSALRAKFMSTDTFVDRLQVTALDFVDVELISTGFSMWDLPIPKIVETGSPAFDSFAAKRVELNRTVARVASPFPRVFHILGQDDSTSDFLAGTLQVADTFEDALAIVALHPKFLAMPELCNAWLNTVRSSKTMCLWSNAKATTHQCMASSSYVVSGYSTALIEAALIPNELGPIAVSWASTLVMERMFEALGGLMTFPTVIYGAAIEVDSVEQFRETVPEPGTRAFRDFRAQARDALRTKLHVDGHAAERIVAAIRQHAEI